MEFSIFLFQIYYKQAAQISRISMSCNPEFPCRNCANSWIHPSPFWYQLFFRPFSMSQGRSKPSKHPQNVSAVLVALGPTACFRRLQYTWLMCRILVCRLECTGVHNMTMCLYVAPKKRKQSFCASMTNQAHTCHIHLLEQHIERKPKCIRINTNESQQTPLGTSSWFVCVGQY